MSLPGPLPRSSYLVPLALLSALLVLGVPLFLASPIWVDSLFYDVCVRNVLHGGTHYRDVFDTNLPGMLWAHAAIRTCLGWSSEALRAVDLTILVGIVSLLAAFVGRLGVDAARRLWLAIAIFFCYFSLPEWCHCQRDVWMLLPALAAVHLRYRYVILRGRGDSARSCALTSIGEALCWSIAIWIKPMIVIPAAACWLAATVLCVRARITSVRAVLLDLALLLGTAGIVGAVGILALLRTGSWPYLLDILRHWNPEYMAYVYKLGGRVFCLYMWIRHNMPWPLLYLAAIPACLWALRRYLLARNSAEEPLPQRAGWVMLAALFLGWMLQVIFLQHGHEYVHVAPLFLALALITLVLDVSVKGYRPLRMAAPVFCAAAILLHPSLRANRLAQWPQAITSDDRLALKDGLALVSDNWGGPGRVDWHDLKRVESYLRSQQVRDREVTCFNDSTFPLYLEMNLTPSTRWVFFNLPMWIFSSRHEEVSQELKLAKHRFVVADLLAVNLQPRDWKNEPDGLVTACPPVPSRWRDRFPWYEPVVFRAGRYVVCRVTDASRPFWTDGGR